jgi:hypothetical protein
MADVASTFAAWSSTTGSNSPAGTATVGNGVDDNIRELQGVVVRALSHKGSDISSASTVDLGAVEGLMHDITGTTTISSFGTPSRAGIWKVLKFEGTLTLTHNSSSLILLSGASRTVKSGDVGIYIAESTSAWRELSFQPAAVDNFTTGDVKLTLKTTADTGWVLMNDGTIGNASSGGTSRANADTEQLFTLLWNNTANADCAVSSGRGASAAADYAANKTIALPKALGRALAGYGAGSGLTSRALAAITGTETHTLTEAEIPSLAHSATLALFGLAQSGAGNGAVGGDATGGQTGTATVSVATHGSGGAHANMQPTLFLNVMIRL